MSPAQLQKVSGWAESTVSMILRGERGISKEAVMKLSKHFKLNAAYFL